MLGTAFFVDDSGLLLTSRSVIATPLAPGARLGLVVRMALSPSQASLVPLATFEAADAPLDLAIARVPVELRPAFALARVEAAPLLWERIASYGCVAVEQPRSDRPLVPVHHALTGNVLREVIGHADQSPALLELSFRVPSRLRGAPLFAYERSRSRLYGVCIGNRSLTVDGYPGASETALDTCGVAVDLRALGGWRPRLLGGRSLREVFPES